MELRVVSERKGGKTKREIIMRVGLFALLNQPIISRLPFISFQLPWRSDFILTKSTAAANSSTRMLNISSLLCLLSPRWWFDASTMYFNWSARRLICPVSLETNEPLGAKSSAQANYNCVCVCKLLYWCWRCVFLSTAIPHAQFWRRGLRNSQYDFIDAPGGPAWNEPAEFALLPA